MLQWRIVEHSSASLKYGLFASDGDNWVQSEGVGGEGVDFLRGRVLVSAWDSYADYLNDHPVKYWYYAVV